MAEVIRTPPLGHPHLLITAITSHAAFTPVRVGGRSTGVPSRLPLSRSLDPPTGTRLTACPRRSTPSFLRKRRKDGAHPAGVVRGLRFSFMLEGKLPVNARDRWIQAEPPPPPSPRRGQVIQHRALAQPESHRDPGGQTSQLSGGVGRVSHDVDAPKRCVLTGGCA